MAIFAIGCTLMTVGVVIGVDQQTSTLADEVAQGASEAEAILLFGVRAKAIWLAGFSGFLTTVLLGTLLTIWSHRKLVERVRTHLEYLDHVANGTEPQAFPTPAEDMFSRLEVGLTRMARVIGERDAAMQWDSERQSFHSQLAQAMSMADTEPEVLEVTRRALGVAAPGLTGELLLADSSQAHLRRELVSSADGGCGVASPAACHAVRRSSSLLFSDSESLDACPHLRDRPAGALSAACVPVSVMGRTVGVLHVTAAAGSPPRSQTVTELTFLADQLGTRVGMIRALATSQLQADTDTLTGLLNRRSFETQIGPLLDQGRPVAIAMCDLDHFKRLNDTFGHATGDRALRVFSEVLQTCLPEAIVGRHGGEEFVVAFPDTHLDEALPALKTVGPALQEAIARAGLPVFTCSTGLTHTTRQGRELPDLLKAADALLYRAKENGRDRIEVERRLKTAS
ncbi:MAG: sensor domain-containing diguanylate cyclase [Proteobacteria bacterium]|nr:sensor domain-containing diguanylate cyclase [Pseudomonadota bacterium]MCP4920924.1 sensor domain-containing diguanylate cyclase [Pseudomonadota bacterium]